MIGAKLRCFLKFWLSELFYLNARNQCCDPRSFIADPDLDLQLNADPELDPDTATQ